MQETDNSNNNEYIEREKQVIELSKQNKSTRYIAEALKMSLRDIGIILKKHGLSHGIAMIKDSNKSPNEKATQAYKLFSEGKKPVNVSIELDLRENEASKYFREFLKLKGQDEVYEIYLENKHYLRSLRKLHRVLKREGMAASSNDIESFVRIVKIGTYKIPELQNEYAKLKGEVEDIDCKKTMAKHALEEMNNQIICLHRTISQLSTTYIKKRNEMAYLQI